MAPWRLNRKVNIEWLCLISACASFWKLAFTSATRPTAGTRRWTPTSLASANNIHIIDLSQNGAVSLHQSLKLVSDTVAKGRGFFFFFFPPGVLFFFFVGTPQRGRQASEIGRRCRSAFSAILRQRPLAWRMLTNWKTISNSIQASAHPRHSPGRRGLRLHQEERLNLEREREKLNRALGGHQGHGLPTPDLMFVIDTNKEAIAIQEAKRLKIPVVAVIDSNCDPDRVDYPDPRQ